MTSLAKMNMWNQLESSGPHGEMKGRKKCRQLHDKKAIAGKFAKLNVSQLA